MSRRDFGIPPDGIQVTWRIGTVTRETDPASAAESASLAAMPA